MCAIFGMINYSGNVSRKKMEKFLRVLSKECEVRGTDATGISYNHNREHVINKAAVTASQFKITLPDNCKAVMGHTRMATHGSEKDNFNNHPFYGEAGAEKFSLAHNGVLWSASYMQEQMGLPRTKIKTDSYLAVQLIEREDELSMKSLAKMAETVSGSFTFTILDEHNNLYIVKGDNPIALYHFKSEGFYVYASTNIILDAAIKNAKLKGKYEAVVLREGDIAKITPNGDIEYDTFKVAYSDFDYPNWYDYRSRKTTSSTTTTKSESSKLAQIKATAEYMGFAEEEIDMLVDFGWGEDEIDEMLCIPGALEDALCEAYEYLWGEEVDDDGYPYTEKRTYAFGS